MLKFHIINIKSSIFTNKNSQSDTFFPKLKNIIVKIDMIISENLTDSDLESSLQNFEPKLHMILRNGLLILLTHS